MAVIRKAATWLDLATGSRLGREGLDLKLHPISAGCGECFVLSLSGRMVCSSDGKLTVFRSRKAVDRFLLLLELDEPPEGPHAGRVSSDPSRQHCLNICGNSLCDCSLEADPQAVTRGARQRGVPIARTARVSREAIV